MTDELKPCHDCGAQPGDLHQLGCDTERCPLCGGQFLSCFHTHRCPRCNDEWVDSECVTDNDGWPTVITDDMRLPWTGIWPGVVECREFGWYAYFDPANRHPTNGPWIRCAPDDPRGSEDLNRLHSGEAEWSREQRRFVLRPTR